MDISDSNMAGTVAGTGEEYYEETPEFIREYRPLFNFIDAEFRRHITTWQAYNRSRPFTTIH